MFSTILSVRFFRRSARNSQGVGCRARRVQSDIVEADETRAVQVRFGTRLEDSTRLAATRRCVLIDYCLMS